MSLTLVYIGAAAGLAPAASLRALAGGGAVFVPRASTASSRARRRGRRSRRRPALELDPADGDGLDELARRAASGDVVGGARRPAAGRSWRASCAARRRPRAPAHRGHRPPSRRAEAFDDALLGQELVSLKRIVDVLRVECPWDREQTPRDIVGYTVEEVYELADAIADDDLGDGARRARRPAAAGRAARPHARASGAPATWAAWPRDIEAKLIRRHPHIFADAVAEHARRGQGRWERIKVEQEGREGIFHDVPAAFPALLLARKLQQRAASVGFDWDSAAEAFPKIAEEHAELAELLSREAAVGMRRPARAAARRRPRPASAHEVGDLLFAVVNVARLLHVDPELALREAARRFERRVDGGRRAGRRRGQRLGCARLGAAGGVLPARQGGRAGAYYQPTSDQEDQPMTTIVDVSAGRSSTRAATPRSRSRSSSSPAPSAAPPCRRAPPPASTRPSSCATAAASTAARACAPPSTTSTT